MSATAPTSAPKSNAAKSNIPWYREPWPWLLMSGPLFVVVAGGFTAWIAFANEDGLVADDYYKQGLAINKVIKREARAADLGVKARIEFGEWRARIKLDGAAPRDLVLQLVHPTRAGLDRSVRLKPDGNGWYSGAFDAPMGRWRIAIEDGDGSWRVAGEQSVQTGVTIVLDARSMAEAGG